MIPLIPPFRLATADDAPVLAQFVNAAGEGLPHYLWSQMAAPGEDPWTVGKARQAEKATSGQIIVIDEGDGAIAGLTGYAIPAQPDPIPDDMPPLFRALQELENLAPSTWYVNVLAALPEHRGRGLGGRLLAVAEEIARASGLDRTSLIVTDTNAGAKQLYERIGYVETARRPMLPDDWHTDITEWILLIKPLDNA
ncbi:MAG: GNAT family N-acetyltransferase [Alphaproteobacteria bacterium]